MSPFLTPVGMVTSAKMLCHWSQPREQFGANYWFALTIGSFFNETDLLHFWATNFRPN